MLIVITCNDTNWYLFVNTYTIDGIYQYHFFH